MLTEEIAVEVTRVVGVSPALWYFRYIASIFLTPHKRLLCIWCSCGTVALMVLGQFSDICGLWSANIRKLAKDNKGYGSAAISGGTTRSQTMI
jgi:energy-converting hydrogenase Eha subunit G